MVVLQSDSEAGLDREFFVESFASGRGELDREGAAIEVERFIPDLEGTYRSLAEDDLLESPLSWARLDARLLSYTLALPTWIHERVGETRSRRYDAALLRDLAAQSWTEIVADVATEGTTLRIDRLDGERLVLDGLGLARGFFLGDPSSMASGSYDSLAGRGEGSMITTADIQAINRTMRARSSHRWWEPVLNRELDWLSALDPHLDLITTSDDEWCAAGGETLIAASFAAAIGPHRGPAVATKVLHLKRPRLFPVLDDFVAVMLGVNIPDDASQTRRAQIALDLVLHLRIQGRVNLEQLRIVHSRLRAEGVDRSLVRILDAILWFSHPAAGVPRVTREITVTATTR